MKGLSAWFFGSALVYAVVVFGLLVNPIGMRCPFLDRPDQFHRARDRILPALGRLHSRRGADRGRGCHRLSRFDGDFFRSHYAASQGCAMN